MRIPCAGASAFLLACSASFSAASPPPDAPPTVPRHDVWELPLESSRDHADPAREVRLSVEYRAPDGTARTLPAFWDGGRRWIARFSPEQPGAHRYATRCSDTSDAGLHDRRGVFSCAEYGGALPLYRRGPLRLSKNRRHFAHADGTPFFWLADTAWCGPMQARECDWDDYLRDRVDKRFTAIQFVATQWRMAACDRDGQAAFTGRDRISINPRFFQRLDRRITAINRAGLIAAPVLLWAIRGEANPGWSLPEAERVLLAGYMVARYGAHQVAWILAGDSDYTAEKAAPWRRIGRAVFPPDGHRLATMHPGGKRWVGDEFRGEPWFSFVGYQSGHGDDEATLRWLTEGPPATAWSAEPPLPVINLEPNYEGHNGYRSRKAHDDLAVRRAAYWSLLVAPPAGVTYGGQGIWGWHERAQAPADHVASGLGATWREAKDLPGACQMRHLREFFDSIPWWRLAPAQDLLDAQPGAHDPARFVAAARAPGGDLAAIYMAEGGELGLRLATLQTPAPARWFHPRTGGWIDAPDLARADAATLSAPDRNDWVLVIGRGAKPPRDAISAGGSLRPRQERPPVSLPGAAPGNQTPK